VAAKKAIVKKDVNPRWRPRNGCDGTLIPKILITTIQICVAFSMFHYDLAPNSPELSSLKFLLLAYHHSHFLAATLDFTSFFIMAFLGAVHLFYSWAVFGLDFTSFCNCMLQS